MENHRRPQDREQLEQKLLEEVSTAEQTYRRARAQTKIILERYADADLPLGDSDGTLAQHQAAANEAMALEKYRQALKLFTDLIIYDRPPEN